MRRHFPGCRLVLLAGIAAALAAAAYSHPVHDVHASTFQTLVTGAMDRMGRAMLAPITGDPDRDFATMMIPHHQGAIDMAEAELRFGHDLILRRLAQGLIVEQQQEIAVMHQALGAFPPAQAVADPRHALAHQH